MRNSQVIGEETTRYIWGGDQIVLTADGNNQIWEKYTYGAGLISRERLSWDQVGYGILILLFLSALLGAATSVKAVKRQRLMIAMGSGLLFWATLIAITALFFGGQYDGMLVTGLVILAASGIVALTGLRRENRKGTASYRRKGL